MKAPRPWASGVWLIAAVAALVAGDITYGWPAAPIEHAWHVASLLPLIGWLLVHRHRP